MTMTTTELVLEETILEDLAHCLNDENPAEWLAGCRTCPQQVLWCGVCHDDKMAAVEALKRTWMCGACGAKSRDWHAAFYTRPV
jgi:hypothetical protein